MWDLKRGTKGLEYKAAAAEKDEFVKKYHSS